MPDKEKENMALWNAVWQTDPANTKPVDDGRHKFTAIDAYSQIKRATEEWGPYGTAWKLDQVQLTYGQVPQLCGLSAVFVYPDGGSFPVGNSIKHTSNKGVVDADHVKKIQTDTITKCLSWLGFNADVFMGCYDDNRYVAEMKEKSQKDHRPDHAGDTHATGGESANNEIASAASLTAFHITGVKISGTQANWDAWRPQVVAWASEHRVESSAQMRQEELNRARDYMEQNQQPPTQGAPAWNQQ